MIIKIVDGIKSDYEKDDLEKMVWDILQEESSSCKRYMTGIQDDFAYSNDYFNYKRNYFSYNNLKNRIGDVIRDPKSQGNSTNFISRNTLLEEIIREVWWDAIRLGLVVPGQLGQEIRHWEQSYQYTLRGFEYFKSGETPLTTSNHLQGRIQEIIDEYNIDRAIPKILEESYRCWRAGCFRAAIVLIGLSMEVTCTDLLDSFKNYPSPPQKEGAENYKNWKKTIDETQSFNSRWNGADKLLSSIKGQLRKNYAKQKPDWWQIWEPIPEIINPFVNYVRMSRNSAAHTVDDIFTSAQIGLLLSSIPFALESIGKLKQFLTNPPEKVTLPQL